MKKFLFFILPLLLLSALVGIPSFSEAKASKKPSRKTSLLNEKKLEKNLNFSDRLVSGKHQVPGEGVVTVENEKPVFNLLSIRSEFKDRREKERQRDGGAL